KKGERIPEGYKVIPYHCIYDVKFDGRRKCRLVAGGHMTDPASEDVFSGVVSMETVRTVFIIAELNGLLIVAGDVGNAYLNSKTKEQVAIKAGPEFPPELQGLWLLIYKALYGLKSSSARFHEHLSVTLRKLGFTPSKADPDLWIKDKGDHYEYIARYVDDVIVFSKDPMAVMNELKKTYIMKGVGKPQYYLGGDVIDLGPEWEKEGIKSAFSAETYIINTLPKLAKLCGFKEFRFWNTPFGEDYHAELDETPLVPSEKISLYQSLLGSANWVITLGRFDICYAINTLSRYAMAPREGHMKAMMRVFGYLRQRPKGKILVDVGEPHVRKSIEPIKNQDWMEFYPDAVEYVPPDRPKPRGKLCTLTCYVDADHARDQLTRRSVTGILILLNNTPISWTSKRQKTVESSTYGSELVATRIAVEKLIALRYNLVMLGCKLETTSLLVGDNMAVVLNTTIPSSAIKKKHQSCNYHKVRESIAAKFIKFQHIKSEDNMADLLTKPLPRLIFDKLTRQYLFRNAKTVTGQTSDKDMKK
ncbi:MAG TPA: reverse transcriptase domain-containing protein, partial [Phormidium sp.]